MSDEDRTRVFGTGAGGAPRGPSHAHPGDDEPHATNRLAVGTRLGEFEIVGVVGEGGFGIVYLAHDHTLDYRLAIKEYMPSSLAYRGADRRVHVKSERVRETFDAGLRSFVTEARLLAHFDHPALVKAFRLWEANGTAYMAMRYYEGVTLKDALAAQPGGPSQRWLERVLVPLLDAVATMHAERVYHRDIAPDNVLLLADGRPVLLDFGAARRVIGEATQVLTAVLKPGFAPIEQYAEIPDLAQGPWTDVYALAAMLYYAIGGRAPPPSVSRMVRDAMPPAREIGAGRFEPSFLAAIDAGLAVRPEHRPASVAAFRDALGLAGGGGSAPGGAHGDPIAASLGAAGGDPFATPPGATIGDPFAASAADPLAATPGRSPAGGPTGRASGDPLADPLAALAGASGAGRSGGTGAVAATAATAPPAGAAAHDTGTGNAGPGPRRWLAGAALAVLALALAGGVGKLLYDATKPPPSVPDAARRSPAPGADTRAAAPPGAAPSAPSSSSSPSVAPGSPERPGPAPSAGGTAAPPSPGRPPAAGTASADAARGALPPFSPAAVLDALLEGASPDRPVSVSTPRSTVRIGDQIRFTVRSEHDGWLYVFLVGTEPTHYLQVFPNGFDADNRIRAGAATTLPRTPRGGRPWLLEAGGPAGLNRFVAIVTPQPRDFGELGPSASGEFPEFDVETLRRRWESASAQGEWIAGRPRCEPRAPCDPGYGAARFTIEETAAR